LHKKFGLIFDIALEDCPTDALAAEIAAKQKIIHADMSLVPVYDYITNLDIRDGNISRYNWSGSDIISKAMLYNSKESRVVNALNYPVTQVWLSGCYGGFKLSRKYAANFVQSFLVDNFLMICVFGNTVILGLDGLVSADADEILSLMNLIFTIIFTVEMVIKLYGLG
jgi:hypothetical protein